MIASSRRCLKRAAIFYQPKPHQHVHLDSTRESVGSGQAYLHDGKTENPFDFLQRDSQERRRLKTESKEKLLRNLGVSAESYSRLQYGATPVTEAQEDVANALDHDLGVLSDDPMRRVPHLSYRHKVLEQRAEVRELQGKLKNLAKPSASYAHAMHMRLVNEDRLQEKARMALNQLEEETGITAEQRLDAYMLGDLTVFPMWARRLSSLYRDRVLFGNLGLSEYDEVSRMRLLRLPMEERRRRWAKMKVKKEEELGVERMITKKELSAVTACTRKYHWLLRQRLTRQVQLRVVQLRNPDKFSEWPSDRVDFSSRLADSGRAVQANFPTDGMWPLDTDAVDRQMEWIESNAEVDRTVETALGTAPSVSSLHPHIAASLKAHGKGSPRHSKKIRWLSRREYKNRWSAVLHGYRDEYGRRTREVLRPWRRRRAIGSYEEFEHTNERLAEPQPWRSREYRHYAQLWSKRYKHEYSSFKDGMPVFSETE